MNGSRSPRRTDLLGRRRLLGATRRAMAAGVGLGIDQVMEIEEARRPTRSGTYTTSASTASRRGPQTSGHPSCSPQNRPAALQLVNQVPVRALSRGFGTRDQLKVQREATT